MRGGEGEGPTSSINCHYRYGMACLNLHKPPPFDCTGISIMHARNSCAPPSHEATLLQLCTPNFHGKHKGNPSFGTKKSALRLCTPRPAKRRPFNYSGANLFGEFTLRPGGKRCAPPPSLDTRRGRKHWTINPMVPKSAIPPEGGGR